MSFFTSKQPRKPRKANFGQVLLSRGQRSDFRANLVTEWERMHELCVHDEQTTIQGDEKTGTVCARLGICVCEGLGLKALRCHRRLVELLRPQFTPRRKRKKNTAAPAPMSQLEKDRQTALATHRRLLQEGFIVLRLEHKPEVRFATGSEAPFQFLSPAWTNMALRSLGTTAQPDELPTVWIHLGHLNFTTWSMAVLVLEEDPEPRADGLLRLVVKQPYRACDALSCFLECMDFSVSWNVTVYNIVSDDRVLTLQEMVPNWVLVRPLPSISSACFWKGWEVEEDIRKEQEMAKERNRKRKAQSTSKPSSATSKHARERLSHAFAAAHRADAALSLEDAGNVDPESDVEAVEPQPFAGQEFDAEDQADRAAAEEDILKCNLEIESEAGSGQEFSDLFHKELAEQLEGLDGFLHPDGEGANADVADAAGPADQDCVPRIEHESRI